MSGGRQRAAGSGQRAEGSGQISAGRRQKKVFVRFLDHGTEESADLTADRRQFVVDLTGPLPSSSLPAVCCLLSVALCPLPSARCLLIAFDSGPKDLQD